ncbi:class I SAM-dependent methyltransferase [Halomonas urumqiensis]|uniref:Class I SAM-dependent methyltransferase n=1 Tax=Halomonas urumqiensis TaxID=1684789 RepID=A0A2N7UME0_9GAMM|nr:class I SAM-dependent methyltransferase [Halomonas urumqiensis]PMR81596.1 class I SAM-dependent methyltransferase [Halomonas urumqiensis]PTB02233.1 class I SAM-dependent methyltransferase [Halomonas urumqiensis]GHE21697.1 SAM-dependent methyltransferase [Halomonas urumqiensis]
MIDDRNIACASPDARALMAHYDALAATSGETLMARVQAALRLAGHDPARLSCDTVAGIDQLHLGGRAASRSLARLGEVQPGTRLLDVGCGTGGASRLLASEFGCEVTGVDITAAFIELARWLSEATGLAEQTRFLCADAADTPLSAASVEAVWCQHALMNMPDPARVMEEWRRLLRPGGRLLLHEVVAGDNPALLVLPVPWARTAATSHLRRRDQLEAELAKAGFMPVVVRDVTESALAWRKKHSRRESDAVSPAAPLPGPALIFGDDFALMGRNLRDNLAAGKVRILEGVWRTG